MIKFIDIQPALTCGDTGNKLFIQLREQAYLLHREIDGPYLNTEFTIFMITPHFRFFFDHLLQRDPTRIIAISQGLPDYILFLGNKIAHYPALDGCVFEARKISNALICY